MNVHGVVEFNLADLDERDQARGAPAGARARIQLGDHHGDVDLRRCEMLRFLVDAAAHVEVVGHDPWAVDSVTSYLRRHTAKATAA